MAEDRRHIERHSTLCGRHEHCLFAAYLPSVTTRLLERRSHFLRLRYRRATRARRGRQIERMMVW